MFEGMRARVVLLYNFPSPTKVFQTSTPSNVVKISASLNPLQVSASSLHFTVYLNYLMVPPPLPPGPKKLTCFSNYEDDIRS